MLSAPAPSRDRGPPGRIPAPANTNPVRHKNAVGNSKRVRADLQVVKQGLAPSLEKARALILAGEVLAGDRPVDKAGDLIDPELALRLRNEPMPFVSRGGVKLDHALQSFAIDVHRKVAIDVGASTGGFTDCLLQRGATRVFAIDVGHGQLAHSLATDERVVTRDRTNIRHLSADDFPAPFDLAVIDVSFISLRLVLPVVVTLVHANADIICLVKPQFEVGRDEVGEGGIVRHEELRQQAVTDVVAAAEALGLVAAGQVLSPITGAKGNVEYLLHLRYREGST